MPLPEWFWEQDDLEPPVPDAVFEVKKPQLDSRQNIIAQFAASMVQPLRTRRDYASLGQKISLVKNFPQGALPLYTKEPDATTVCTNTDVTTACTKGPVRSVVDQDFDVTAFVLK